MIVASLKVVKDGLAKESSVSVQVGASVLQPVDFVRTVAIIPHDEMITVITPVQVTSFEPCHEVLVCVRAKRTALRAKQRTLNQ